MMLLVKSGGEKALAEWQAEFAALVPQLEVRSWSDPQVDPADVAYVLVWEPEHGRLARMPNLKLICSSAAGVDHILSDPDWPRHLSIVRMAAPETAQRMSEFVCLGALSLLRDMKRIITQQAACNWDEFETPRCAPEVTAGVMGLGNLGAHAAQTLRAIGFRVAGWSRTPKELPGIQCFAGAGQLDAFLEQTDLLVCLLPNTPETAGILDRRRLGQLPAGAGVINVGRGSHVVLPDLIAMLDTGHLSGAFLDVFEPEPLPADHPAWRHKRIIVTPHVASAAGRRARARYVAETIARFERGEPLAHVFNPERGY